MKNKTKNELQQKLRGHMVEPNQNDMELRGHNVEPNENYRNYEVTMLNQMKTIGTTRSQF